MKSLSYRTFIIDTKKYRFSKDGFNYAINEFRTNKRMENTEITISKIIDNIADTLGVSSEAVRNWRRGYNGPSDLNLVRDIASELCCEMMSLLENLENDSNIQTETKDIEMTLIDTNENHVIISIINDMIELMDTFSDNYCLCSSKLKILKKNAAEIQNNYYSKWAREIGIKLRQNRYYISKNNYEKLHQLYMETISFIDFPSRLNFRWGNIYV